jgi:hypothetical protein
MIYKDYASFFISSCLGIIILFIFIENNCYSSLAELIFPIYFSLSVYASLSNSKKEVIHQTTTITETNNMMIGQKNTNKLGKNASINGSVSAGNSTDSFKTPSPHNENNSTENQRLGLFTKNKGFIITLLIIVLATILTISYYVIEKGIITNETINKLIDKNG